MTQQVRHGVVDLIFCLVADIREVRFLDSVNNVLHKSLLHSRHFSKQTHFLGVQDLHDVICVSGCAIRDDDQNRVSRVDEGSW